MEKLYRIEQTKNKTNLVTVFVQKGKNLAISKDLKAFENQKGRVRIFKGLAYIIYDALDSVLKNKNYKIITEL